VRRADGLESWNDASEPCANRAQPSKVLIAPTGDHYASMIEQGIPAAIEWLDAVSGLTSIAPAAR
jgi:hypothetical protein